MRRSISSIGTKILDEKTAKVVVPDYQLSLAIGKEGQNARLAARLTGYKIDIKSETQAKDAEGFRYEDYMFDEDGDVYYEEEYEEGEYDDSEYAASEDTGYEEDESEESGYDASEVEAEDALYEEETEG